MDQESFVHTGILGMKWGFRKAKQKTISKPKSASTRLTKTPTKPVVPAAKKSIKEMSDSEMKDVIGRMELEKRYKDLVKADQQAEASKGKAFVMNILEASGKNIATQVATYAMGTALNKAVGSEIVNPKKGQKDK